MAACEYILRGPELSAHLPTFKTNTSVLDVLHECLRNNGSDIAQIEVDTGKIITYEEMYRASTSIASNLTQRYGITRDDVVALCTETCIDAYCMLLGVIFTGATAALLSPKLKHDDMRRLLSETKSKTVYCSEDCVETVSKAATCQVIIVNADQHSPSYIDYCSLVESQDTSFRVFEVTDIRKHAPILLFSSGTTGLPKGILITNIGLQRLAYIFCADNIKTFISLSSFIWISSVATALSGVIKKHRVIWSPLDIEKLLKNTEKYQVDTWMMTPGTINALLKHPALHEYEYSTLSVRYVFIGGAVLPNSLREAFVKTVCKNRIAIVNMYGMSETGIITGRYNDEDLINADKSDSVGRLLSGAELKIIDENGKAVGPNTDGELLVKSIASMAGYWGLQNTHTGFHGFMDNEGWFHTGDVGHFDIDGFIYITGRKKDIVLVKSEKVSVAEVEGLLASHPGIREATVIAKPHPIDTNHLIAFVVRKEDAHLTEDDVIKFVEEQAEDAKRLCGGAIFLDAIPKTLSGKINQHELYKKLNN